MSQFVTLERYTIEAYHSLLHSSAQLCGKNIWPSFPCNTEACHHPRNPRRLERRRCHGHVTERGRLNAHPIDLHCVGRRALPRQCFRRLRLLAAQQAHVVVVLLAAQREREAHTEEELELQAIKLRRGHASDLGPVLVGKVRVVEELCRKHHSHEEEALEVDEPDGKAARTAAAVLGHAPHVRPGTDRRL